MSSFNESVGLGYLKTNAIEFVKYPYLSVALDLSRKQNCYNNDMKVGNAYWNYYSTYANVYIWTISISMKWSKDTIRLTEVDAAAWSYKSFWVLT